MGTGAMQNDITDGVEYMIREGIANPKRVAIAGGSYGGYATLAGLAFTPDLYAAGFDVVGPSNIITLLKSIPPYWAPMKKIFAVRVGDTDNPEDLKMLEKQSPLNSAKKITAPLFVVQGANDPRVKKAESDQIVVALRDLGRNVEYMVAPDEGHGFAGKLNTLAMFTAMEQFLAKYVGGRVQKDVRPEIKEKMDSITVDTNTVKVSEKNEKADPSTNVLSLNPDLLKNKTLSYATNIDAQGQKITGETVCAISRNNSDGRALIQVGIASSFAGASSTNTIDYEADTLMPVEQHANQGPVKIEVYYTPEGVTGSISSEAQNMPLKLKSDKQIFPSEWGILIPLSTIPLEKGYIAEINQFDLMTQSSKGMIVKVEGTEKVTVKAGTFTAFKVSLTPLEGEGGGSFWIDASTRNILKSETKLPPMMGGGSVINELVK
jgi:dienelactone hydrolase